MIQPIDQSSIKITQSTCLHSISEEHESRLWSLCTFQSISS